MNKRSIYDFLRPSVNGSRVPLNRRGKIIDAVVMIIVIAIAFALFVPGVTAQDTPPELTCDTAEINNLVADWSFLDQLSQARDAEDIDTLYQAVINADLVIDVIRQACNPLQWEGSGGSKVLDPVFIETGVYRVIITGERNDTITGEALMGECNSIFLHITGDGSTQGETSFRSSGCLMLLEVSSGVPWTVTFEKLG